MRLLHRLADWDCNRRYTRWLQRLHARIHDREDRQLGTGRYA
jgi:hypothetical protein